MGVVRQAQGREEGSVVVPLVAVGVLVEEGGDVVEVPALSCLAITLIWSNTDWLTAEMLAPVSMRASAFGPC